MIALQRLNGQEFILNSDLIESLESTPDTVIKLVSGRSMIVKNDISDIVKKCVKYRQFCNSTLRVVNDRESRGSE